MSGAKKETINHHCHVQTRLESHEPVRGGMEVMWIRCGSIISFINKMSGRVDVQATQFIPEEQMCFSTQLNAHVDKRKCSKFCKNFLMLRREQAYCIFSKFLWQTRYLSIETLFWSLQKDISNILNKCTQQQRLYNCCLLLILSGMILHLPLLALKRHYHKILKGI